MTLPFDRRLTPARPDLAARRLEGQVEAARFADPTPMVVTAPLAPMLAVADPAGPIDTQLLFGERIAVYEAGRDWSWGQAELDGYVGYVPTMCLDPAGAVAEPTHRIAVPSAPVYPAADLRSVAMAALGYGARVAVAEIVPGTKAGGTFARLDDGRYLAEPHIRALDDPAPDWVAEAERLLGLPYVWGGRSGMGVDCSGLVQLAMQAAGLDCPRDSDMQEAALGAPVEDGPLRRGDLVFWKGHVGVMTDRMRLLHANIHHMAVAAEPLPEAEARIEQKGGGPVTRRLRPETGVARDA